jgi:hypothetical protein
MLCYPGSLTERKFGRADSGTVYVDLDFSSKGLRGGRDHAPRSRWFATHLRSRTGFEPVASVYHGNALPYTYANILTLLSFRPLL